MNFIPLARPDINEDDILAVAQVLRSGMLVQGAKVETLEKEVSSFLRANHAAAVSNGTATLHLALKALGIGAGDEVIVPAFSYVATANVVELVGATCVFVDIDLRTFNIDVTQIESKITSKTKAIIPVHEFGLICDMESIMQIAKKHNLKVIEDAACALGAEKDGRYAGTYGDFGSFSLHPRKAISSGEGGILVSPDDKLIHRIKILRNHGIELTNGQMEFVDAGYNYRMTDFQAALVSSQLTRLQKIIDYKQSLAQRYFSQISNNKITLPHVPAGIKHTWQTFHVLVDSSLNRNQVIDTLKTKGIGTNYGAQCIPAQVYYQKKYSLNCEREFPQALKAYQQGLAIPLYERLTLENISYISDAINTL